MYLKSYRMANLTETIYPNESLAIIFTKHKPAHFLVRSSIGYRILKKVGF